MQIQGSVLWLSSQASGQTVPVTTDTNGNIGATTNTISNDVFNGTLSGAILGCGRIDDGQVVAIKVNQFGAI